MLGHYFRFIFGLMVSAAVLVFSANEVVAASLPSFTEVDIYNKQGNTVEVNFTTDVPTMAVVELIDRLDKGEDKSTKQSDTEFNDEHSFIFRELPDSEFTVLISAEDEHRNIANFSNKPMVDVQGVIGIVYSLADGGQVIADDSRDENNSGGSQDTWFPTFLRNDGDLQIKDVNVEVIDKSTVKVTWATTQSAWSGLILRNSASQQMRNTFEHDGRNNHESTFCGLENDGTFDLAIFASYEPSPDPDTVTIYLHPQQITLSGPQVPESQLNCSDTSDRANVGRQDQPEANSSKPETGDNLLQQFLFLEVREADGRMIYLQDKLVVAALPLTVLSTLLVSYFFLKRRRLWGLVYDARTKNPVEMAVIRLFDQEHHKLLETRVTDKTGRYSFLARPGEYYLEITKEGYHFPSRIVTANSDNEYQNLYRGEIIRLGAGQSLISPDIPIDSEAGEVKHAGFLRRAVFPILDAIRLPIVLISLLLVAVLVFAGDLEGQPVESQIQFVLPVLIILLPIEFLMIRRGRK